MQLQEGLIVRALGGFYTVQPDAGGGPVECRARGLFRKEGVSPLVGDRVSYKDAGDGGGYLEAVAPRRNSLKRPPVANIDALVLVCSILSPPPNLLVLDKLIAVAEFKGIEPLIAVTKTDLPGETQAFCDLYRGAGFSVFPVCAATGEGVPALRAALAGKTSCFCGNTGAGKSSLLNAIDPRLTLETGAVSEKLGRGRHTTRHAQLYALPEGGYVADTPGFSAVDLSKYEVIRKDEVQACFREFAPFLGRCRFVGCSHTCEDGCAVLAAAGRGEIAASRLESYRVLAGEAGRIKEWELAR